MERGDDYSFQAKIVVETDMAYLLDVDGKQVWFPKSKIEGEGDNWWTVPEWIAIEKEIV